MKKLFVLLITLAVLALPVAAAPVWVADGQTGCQVCFSGTLPVPASLSWSGGAVDGKADGRGQLKLVYRNGLTTEGTVDMRQGVIHGQVSLRWSDGMTYEGGFENNLFSGEGKLTFPDGASYVGGYANGGYEGHGVLTERSGRVKYDGLFERNTFKPNPFDGKVTPSIGGLLDGFQGIPWGTSEAVVVSKTAHFGKQYIYNERLTARIGEDGFGARMVWYDVKSPHPLFFFHDDRLLCGAVRYSVYEDKVLEKLDEVKAALIAKYGTPDEEKGKFLDKEIVWYFGVPDREPNTVRLRVLTNPSFGSIGVQVIYTNGSLMARYWQTKAKGGKVQL